MNVILSIPSPSHLPHTPTFKTLLADALWQFNDGHLTVLFEEHSPVEYLRCWLNSLGYPFRIYQSRDCMMCEADAAVVWWDQTELIDRVIAKGIPVINLRPNNKTAEYAAK